MPAANPVTPAGFSREFPRFPVPSTKGRSWHLSSGGKLLGRRGSGAPDAFRWDPKARPLDNLEGGSGADEGGVWTASPDYNWQEPPEGTGVAYVTKPLAEDTIVVGSGFVKVWVRARKPSVDLQATVTEVRPDDRETFVQGGWVRASMRKLDRQKSTPLAPVLSLRKAAMKPLPRGRFAKVTIPLYYQGHAYRVDSRIRVLITAPNGDQPIWAFEKTKPKRKTKISIAHNRKRPSNLTLPVIPEGEIPTELPPCPGLRGQPCRDYAPAGDPGDGDGDGPPDGGGEPGDGDGAGNQDAGEEDHADLAAAAAGPSGPMVGGDGSAAGDDAGGLPFTGLALGGLLTLALALLAAGSLARRARRQ